MLRNVFFVERPIGWIGRGVASFFELHVSKHEKQLEQLKICRV